MTTGHALGRWVLFSRAFRVDQPLTSLDESETAGVEFGLVGPDDFKQLIRRGAKGRSDAAILADADIAIVGRDERGRVLFFHCAALKSFSYQGYPFPFHVAPGEARTYHAETERSARGRGLARRGLLSLLKELEGRGVQRVWAHTTEQNSTVRRYVSEFGFDEVGSLTTIVFGETLYWIAAADWQVFDAEPQFRSEGFMVYAEQGSDVARLAQEFHRSIQLLREEGARVALLGSGAAAAQLLTLVPSLQPLIAAVADSDHRRQGATFVPTGHRIVAPKEWMSTGATHLLYASKAYQEEMHDQHRAFGPDGSLGIRIHPRVEVVTV